MKLTGMNYEMSLKLGHIAKEPIFDLFGMLGLRREIVAHLATFSVNAMLYIMPV